MIRKRADKPDDILVSIKNNAQADKLELFEARENDYALSFKSHEGVISEVVTTEAGEPLKIDSITEKTLDAGVEIQGMLIKDASIKNVTNLGLTTVETVSIEEYGDGRDFTTVLTLTDFFIGTLAGAGVNLGLGRLVYRYPSGQHFELVNAFSSLSLKAAGTAVATDTGLGSVVVSGAVAVLSGTATFEDRLTGQTISTAPTGGAGVSALAAATAGIGTGISLNTASSVKNIYLNCAGTWNADNVGQLLCSGTIILKWTRM